MICTIKQLGGSVAIVIPKPMASEAGLSAGTTVDMTAHEGGILVRRSGRAQRPIDEIVAELPKAAYARHSKELTEKPVGKEIW